MPRTKKVLSVGQKFNKLTILAEHPVRKNREFVWVCECDCGNQKLVTGHQLRSGKTRSCGCYRREEASKRCRARNRPIPEQEAIKNRAIATYKRNAKVRKIEWRLSSNQALALMVRPCHYCGIDPARPQHGPGGMVLFNGIDRMDNSRGYITDNVVASCRACNIAKAEMTLDEFKKWVVRVYNKIGKETNNERL